MFLFIYRLYVNEEKFWVVWNVKLCKWYKLYDLEKYRVWKYSIRIFDDRIIVCLFRGWDLNIL